MLGRVSRRYVLIDLVLLAAVLILAFAAFHNSSSYGDDLGAFSRFVWRNGFVEMRDAYLHSNGRLGNHITIGLLRLMLDPLPLGPDSFPWWILFGASYYFLIAAALHFAVAFAEATSSTSGRVYFLAAFISLLIVPTAAVFETATYAICVVYTFGVWLLSLLFRIVSSSNEVTFVKLASIASLYVIVALSSEQLLVACPVLFCTLTVARWQRRSIEVRHCLLEIVTWLSSSAIAALIYFLSPGQRLRNSALSVHYNLSSIVGQLPQWYVRAVNATYETLFGAHTWYVLGHTALIAVVASGILLMLIERLRHQGTDQAQLIGAIICLAFLIAPIASLIHLLVSPHFPEGRARFFPSLLLAAGLSFAAVLLFQRFGWTVNRLRGYGVAGLALIAVLVTVPDLSGVADDYRRFLWLDEMRKDVRGRILRMHMKTAFRRFRLSGCVMNLDAPWGFDAYFAWRGYSLTVAPIGLQHLYPGVDSGWAPVGCVVPPLVTHEVIHSSNPAEYPLRVIIYTGPGATALASWDSDFWVPPQTEAVRIRGDFNPNSLGGPPYRDVLSYRIFFATRWDTVRREPFVVMQPQLEGALVSPPVETSVYYVYEGALTRTVPLSAFERNWSARPFVRLGIRNAGVAYPGWTSNFRLHAE